MTYNLKTFYMTGNFFLIISVILWTEIKSPLASGKKSPLARVRV
jgi:hypothetical protein